MPTYEYECGACGHRFEKFQSMNDKPVKKCPECGKAKSGRVISGGAGVLFKGSGFYQTDYRSKSYKEAAKKDAPKKEAPAAPSCSGDCSSCPTSKK
jgi:putative FmdB family regulatory protein